MRTKNSFGGGYGINRKVGGKSALSAAVPPMGNVNARPGVGKAHHKHVNFSAKITPARKGRFTRAATGGGVMPKRLNPNPPASRNQIHYG
jgi:hypothetical protein